MEGELITLKRTSLKILLMAIACAMNASSKPMVALDCYHNNEDSPHYTWSLAAIGGFSQLAGIVLNLGGDTMSIGAVLDSTALSKANVLIIVDPDTTTEAPSPKYISVAETAAVNRWVMQGGVLMMLANNAGNCEFTHLNWLASQFGIRFNGDTYSTIYNLTPLPSHAFFAGCDTLYIKDISTFTLTTPAQAVLTLGGRSLMATSTKGKGTIFALGDPWLYNEYINTEDNYTSGTNVMRWLLAQVQSATVRWQHSSAATAHLTKSPRHKTIVAPNGRKIGPGKSTGIFFERSADGVVKKGLLIGSDKNEK
jgi:hypothetical protein